MKETLIFKKQRELGEILTDTFKFLRISGKQLFGLIFRIAGPALIMLVLSYVYYMQSTLGSIGPLGFKGDFLGSMLLSLFLIVISGMVYYALMYGTIMYAIKSYIKNDGIIINQEVIAGVKQDFWSLIGLSFLFLVMVTIGFFMCLIPGIYLGTVLASIYAIHVFEKRDVTDSISYSFSLIKGEWWTTFATYFVLFLLYYFIMIIFQIPQYIYFFTKGFIISETFSVDPTEMFDWGYIALNALGLIGQYLLYAMIVISTAFVYFNLNEKRNFTGTMETIETIGNRED